MDFADRSHRTDSPQWAQQDPHGWFYREGLHFCDVESVLDWLERTGVDNRTVEIEPAGTFRVRWRAAP